MTHTPHELYELVCPTDNFHHTTKQGEHGTDRGENPSVAKVAKNVCTHDTAVKVSSTHATVLSV